MQELIQEEKQLEQEATQAPEPAPLPPPDIDMRQVLMWHLYCAHNMSVQYGAPRAVMTSLRGVIHIMRKLFKERG